MFNTQKKIRYYFPSCYPILTRHILWEPKKRFIFFKNNQLITTNQNILSSSQLPILDMILVTHIEKIVKLIRLANYRTANYSIHPNFWKFTLNSSTMLEYFFRNREKISLTTASGRILSDIDIPPFRVTLSTFPHRRVIVGKLWVSLFLLSISF